MHKNFDQLFKHYWETTADSLRLDTQHSAQIFQYLSRSYSQTQRYYHNQQHIVECLALYEQIKHKLKDANAVLIAIWFHDAVYDPQAKDNEQQSAEMMKAYCSEFLEQFRLNKIYDWIIATQFHRPIDDPDLQYLLDIDLLILGSSPERFQQYESQIQQEYAWVDPHIFKVKRREVLQAFRLQVQIYQTEYFQKKFSTQAQQNLDRALS